jgi:hypothetical protein
MAGEEHGNHQYLEMELTTWQVQVKVHWSYYGSNDDKNEGLSIPKNGHHL